MKIFDQVSSDIRIRELGTWAGRSKFWYEGSVEQGIIIHFGNNRSRRIRAGLFANMLERFAGCAVKVGTSRTNPPRDSLGSWLMENVTKTSIASYVAPILVAEGIASRDEKDSTALHFMDGISLVPDYDSISDEYFDDGFAAYDRDAGEFRTINGIDGKTLACLDYEGKLKYKRVPWERNRA